MTPGQIAALAVGALLVFWMLGAYNRLVGLRNAIGAAIAQFDAQLQRRAQALPELLAALREPLTSEAAALDAAAVAEGAVQAAARHVRARPARADAAAALAASITQLDAALARVLALLDQQPEVRMQAAVAAGLRELHDVDLRLAFARQLHNDAVVSYNAAVLQWPTRLLKGLYGFGLAGPL